MSRDGFLVRWRRGMSVYADSLSGGLFLRLVFLSFVVVGLFGAAFERWFSGDFWLGLFLFGFGCVSVLDWRGVRKQLLLVKGENKIFKGGKK